MVRCAAARTAVVDAGGDDQEQPRIGLMLLDMDDTRLHVPVLAEVRHGVALAANRQRVIRTP